MPPRIELGNRLTDAGVRNAREQALRAVRRVQRKMDTKIEVLERRMDRAIENKERITIKTAVGVIEDFKKVVDVIRAMENALADMAQIFSRTS